MQSPPYLSTIVIPSQQLSKESVQSIQALTGVNEVAWFKSEGLLLVKIDKHKIEERVLRNRLETGSLDD